MIHYLIGDATHPVGDEDKIIAHIVNDVGKWGAGFSGALSKRWPQAGPNYINYFNNPVNQFGLGKTFYTSVGDLEYMLIANMCAQHGVRRRNVPIRYDALKTCLKAVAETAVVFKAQVHMPRIGCGLAGGNWSTIEPLIQSEMSDVEVFVYDLQ